jgi:hypothetical protein
MTKLNSENPAFSFGELVHKHYLLSRVLVTTSGPLCLRVSGAVAPSALVLLLDSPAWVLQLY